MDRDDFAWAINMALQEAERRSARERIATAVFAASNPTTRDSISDADLARAAVEAADALIAELDKPVKP